MQYDNSPPIQVGIEDVGSRSTYRGGHNPKRMFDLVDDVSDSDDDEDDDDD